MSRFSGPAPLPDGRDSMGLAGIRGCVKCSSIHRFLWSRLAKAQILWTADNEPRPQGAVSIDLSNRLLNARSTFTVLALTFLFAGLAMAQNNPAAIAARQWRQAHERAIVDEFIALLSIPNIATDRKSVV